MRLKWLFFQDLSQSVTSLWSCLFQKRLKRIRNPKFFCATERGRGTLTGYSGIKARRERIERSRKESGHISMISMISVNRKTVVFMVSGEDNDRFMLT